VQGSRKIFTVRIWVEILKFVGNKNCSGVGMKTRGFWFSNMSITSFSGVSRQEEHVGNLSIRHLHTEREELGALQVRYCGHHIVA
jgi:hypothetical protein